jgi:hypothetical protein
MSSPFSTRLMQFLVANQPTVGTLPTLDAATGRLRLIEGSEFGYDAEVIESQRLRKSFSPRPHRVGTKAMGFTLKSEMNTPDTITDALEEAPLLAASGIVVTAARSIGRGAFTPGTPARNATVTGATSGAIGRLLLPPAWTPNALYIAPVSGTFQSGEVLNITGGITCTSTTAAVVAGWYGLPVSPATSVVGGRLEKDGKVYVGRDMAGTFGFEAANSNLGMWTWTLLGAREDIGESAMATGIAFDQDIAPLFQAADLVIGSSFLPVLASVSYTHGGDLVKRGNANMSGNTGLIGGRQKGRKPMFKITFEVPNESDFDAYAAFDGSSTVPVRMRLGQDIGKSIGFFADAWCPGKPSESDADGLAMFEIDGVCTSATDDREVEFVWF